MNDYQNATFLKCDVVVVGAGPAGCTSALKAKENGLDVLLLDKADPRWSGSAGRGIDLLHLVGKIPTGEQAIKDALWPRYYDEPHFANENVLYRCWEKENWALAELEKYVNLKWYDGDYLYESAAESRQNNDGRTSLRFPGMDMKPQLNDALIKAGVNVLKRTMIVDVLTNNGRCVGVTAVNTRTAEFYVIEAPAVVLATGYWCRHTDPEMPSHKYKYKYHHCPSALSGDGLCAAMRAGAEVMNMELCEGSVPHDDYTCVTRGCLIGSRPITNREYTADGELLPHNVTKKEWAELDRAGRTPLYRALDHMPETFAKRHEVNYTDEGFANLKLAGERGFNPRDHWYSVSRDKPYVICGTALDMGGLVSDENFMTTIPGLFGAGDILSGCGAVMSACVTGFWTGEYITDYIKNIEAPKLDDEQVKEQLNAAAAPLHVKGEGQDPIEFEGAVRTLTEKYVGVMKSEGKLVEGQYRLRSLVKNFEPYLKGENPHYLMRCLEDKNIALIAELYMQACQSRKETRGLYNRADYPEKDPARDGILTYQHLEEDGPVVELKAAPRLDKALFAEGGN